MPKQLLFEENARQSLLKGIDLLAKAVITTLGPKGRNVAIDKKWGAPSVIHDGVTVAKEIELENPFENMGAQLVKEAADKTNDAAGDGTTTATLLAHAMIQTGLKNVTAGANPMIIKKGIEKGVKAVVGELEKMKIEISANDTEEIAQVATISAADREIGLKIADAVVRVGKDGLISAEEGKGLDIETRETTGMEFDNGFASPYFVTDPESMEASIENPYILITDKKISSIQEIVPFLEKAVKVTKNFVIIADDIEGEALATLIVNKLKGTFSVLAVKAPGFGDRRKAILEDIAILTGGTVISEDTGRKLDSVTLEDCGQAETVVADKDSCRIVGGKGQPASIAARVSQLKTLIDKSDSDYDKEKLQERLSKLAGGAVVLEVGGASEIEMKEKLERVKDAVGATKAAVEEGILPGGGVALLKAKTVLDKLSIDNPEEKIGLDILRYALEQPVRLIAQNSGQDGGYILGKVEEELQKTKKSDYGYNVSTGKFGSMIKAGVLDPFKVTKSALQNAASVAIMVLTTEVLITDLPEKEKDNPSGGGMPPGMSGMGM
jgi:chaperonin GroEL